MGPSDAGGLPEAFMLQMLFRVALQQQVGGGLSEQLSKLKPPEEGWCLDWQALLLASAVCFVFVPSHIITQCLGHSSHS